MASTFRVVALTAFGALAWGCSGDLTGGRDGAVPPGDASIGLDARIPFDAARLPDGRVVEGVDGGGTIAADAGIELPIDAGPCVGSTLAEMVSITPIA
jgi:hypothetical protein